MKRAQRPARHRMSARASPSSNSTSISAIAGRLSARLQDVLASGARKRMRLRGSPMNRGHVLKGGWAGVARGMEAGWPRPQRGLGAQHDSPATAEPALAQTDGKRLSCTGWNVIYLSTPSTNASDLWRTRRVGGWDMPASDGPMAPGLDRALALGAWCARHPSRRCAACSKRQ